ncbi:hypothetical protein KEM60_01637 [Austwickia sp. TVS 96-490-7B]|nr:hypothetical protein [Austwickia sp. TVS 96-490-7B]MBW3085437.1 hypothetical protein [Austwickia sp. TVS 96-490-7B]
MAVGDHVRDMWRLHRMWVCLIEGMKMPVEAFPAGAVFFLMRLP